MSEVDFFQDLAILIVIAGVVSVLFAKLKWPKVLGYIGAGVLMSPYTWGGSFLENPDTFQVIGQLGVIYLMFTMGLDFSMSSIKRIKHVVMPVAIIDTIVMTWLGYTIGTSVLGWGMVPSLFLGVSICDSATTMLAKVIDEMKWGEKPFVRYTLGTSVCEDIICVALLAVITGVANGKGVSLAVAASSLGGLFVFFLAVIVFGLVFIPRLLKSVAKTHDDEAQLLLILGLCFFVSWLAFKFEFSLALGAFLVGVIGASSAVRKHLVDLVAPLKFMYSAIFFVSIGLMVNPVTCFNELPTILFVMGVVMAGKFLNCTLGALLTGQSVKTSVQMGMSLAQIGEFAFMVAIIYQVNTGDTQCPIFGIVVSVSILTTLLNPMMIRSSASVGQWVEDHLPKHTHRLLDAYRGFVAKYQASKPDETNHRKIRSLILRLGILVVLNFSVVVVFVILRQLDYAKFSVFFNSHKHLIFSLVMNILLLASLAPAYMIGRALGGALSTVLLGEGEARWQQSMRNIITLVLGAVAVSLIFVEMGMLNVVLAPVDPAELWVVRGVLLLVLIFGGRFLTKASLRAKTRFYEALDASEREEKLQSVMTFTVPEEKITRFVLNTSSPAVGDTIGRLNIRAKTGAVIASIERKGEILHSVTADTELEAGDTIVAVCEGPQVSALKDLLGIVSEMEES